MSSSIEAIAAATTDEPVPDERVSIHQRRAAAVLRTGLYLLAATEGFWAMVGVLQGQPWLTTITAATALGAIALLYTRGLSTNSRAHGAFWLFFAFTWTALVFLEGLGGPHGTFNQNWFIVAALATLLVLFDASWRVKAAYIALCVLSFAVAEFALVSTQPMAPLPPTFKPYADAVGMCAYFAVTLVLALSFVRDIADGERRIGAVNDEIENLLGNMLPPTISERLRREGRTFADGYVQCSVLFADLVGFTSLARSMHPAELVELLDRIFSDFDDLTADAGLEKIKTIGDAYMVASGVPYERDDHALALADLALAMRAAMATYPGLALRIGMHSGPVVAGVIGKKRYIYDLWGDTVNLASRMESQGVPGEIQLSAAMFALLEDEFRCECRSELAVKGHRAMTTYFLRARKRHARAPQASMP